MVELCVIMRQWDTSPVPVAKCHSICISAKKPRQNAVVLPVLMLKRVKSNILRQTEAGGPVGGRGGRVEPNPAHIARHVHADRSHRSLPPQKYFVGAENIVNRSDAVRSEDNLSLTDRGCNTVQCTAPHCTTVQRRWTSPVPRTEVMMRLLTVTSPDLPYLSDTPHHDMFPAVPTCRTYTEKILFFKFT